VEKLALKKLGVAEDQQKKFTEGISIFPHGR